MVHKMAQKRDEKRIKKMRASRTCGYGTQGQHRKGGQRGGRGNTGGKKHKWTWIVKNDPKYFGKFGFKRPPKLQKKNKIINVGDLNDKIAELLENNIAKKEDNLISLNLSEIGYDKVLGTGKINYPLKIKAKNFSKDAIKKINDAGGEIFLIKKK